MVYTVLLGQVKWRRYIEKLQAFCPGICPRIALPWKHKYKQHMYINYKHKLHPFHICLLYSSSVPTFISSTKCAGSQVIGTWPHAQLLPSFLGTDAWIVSQLNVALICKLRRSSIWFAYFLTYYLWVLSTTRYWQTSSRLHGAGINCLLCNQHHY